MRRRAVALLAALLFLCSCSSPSDAPALKAINPWINVRMPASPEDVAVIGFVVQNITDESIKLLDGEYAATSPEVKLQCMWVSHTTGYLSGSLQSISDVWNDGEEPLDMRGICLDPGEELGITFVFTVPSETARISKLAVTYSRGQSDRVRKWLLNGFEALVLEVES